MNKRLIFGLSVVLIAIIVIAQLWRQGKMFPPPAPLVEPAAQVQAQPAGSTPVPPEPPTASSGSGDSPAAAPAAAEPAPESAPASGPAPAQ